MGQDTLSANNTYIEYAWIITCLTRIAWPGITRNALRGETGPDGQNIFGRTDKLINDFCERQYLYVLRQ